MIFVDYELAKKLKEKGFNEQCLAYYTKDKYFYYNTSYNSDIEHAFKSFNSRPNHICGKRIDAPTISQVLKWLREEKKIFVDIRFNRYYQLYKFYVFTMSADSKDMYEEYLIKTYEQAALAGIEYVLDNLI